MDLSGCKNLDDNAFVNLYKAELPGAEEWVHPTHPGLKCLHTLKISNLNIGDYALLNLAKVAPNLESLEIAACKSFTDTGLE